MFHNVNLMVLANLLLTGENNNSCFYETTVSIIKTGTDSRFQSGFFLHRYSILFKTIQNISSIREINISDLPQADLKTVFNYFDDSNWLALENYYFDLTYSDDELKEIKAFDFLLVTHPTGVCLCLGITDDTFGQMQVYGVKKCSKAWEFLFRKKTIMALKM